MNSYFVTVILAKCLQILEMSHLKSNSLGDPFLINRLSIYKILCVINVIYNCVIDINPNFYDI